MKKHYSVEEFKKNHVLEERKEKNNINGKEIVNVNSNSGCNENDG